MKSGSTATSYEPFTNGLATPDYPQDIHVVTGDNTVKVVGRNLANNCTTKVAIASQAGSLTGYVVRTNNDQYRGCFIKVEPNMPISISRGDVTSNSRFRYGFIKEFPADNIPIYNPQFEDNVLKIENIIVPDEMKYLVVYLSNTGEITNNFQIEVGTTATPYEPYTEQTQLISLGSIELAKIGYYADRIYKSGGKWYLYKAIGKYIFNGSENNWEDRPNYAYADRFVLNYWVGNNISSNILNNYFPVSSSSQQTYPYVWNNSGQGIVNFSEKGTTTLAQFKAWLSTHNLIVYVKENTPTTTEITDTTLIGQLENILAMHTNKNVTNAWIEPSGTNAQGGLTLTYYRDLQTITDKIDSLEARVSLLE